MVLKFGKFRNIMKRENGLNVVPTVALAACTYLGVYSVDINSYDMFRSSCCK